MRSSLDLLDLPFVFTQSAVLPEDRFIRDAKERGVQLNTEQLEAMHRSGLLVPFFRVRRDTRRRRSHPMHSFDERWRLSEQPRSADELKTIREENRLHDPAHDGFRARHWSMLRRGDLTFRPTAFVYGAHQMLNVPLVLQALPYLRWKNGRSRFTSDINRDWVNSTVRDAVLLREVALAGTVLEAEYLSGVTGSLALPSVEAFSAYEAWKKRRRLTAALQWLGRDAEWLSNAAAGLLRRAEHMDPLGRWFEVVREGDPDRWKELRGAARSALDLRLAAELLLRYYEDLHRGRKARALNQTVVSHVTRLKPQRTLDRTLTRFGLSPHPALILVLEGATERILFPRVMRHFEVSDNEEFISIQDAEGVDRDVQTLVAYAVAPRTEHVEGARYRRLARPPTRLLVVTDAEGKSRTAQQRKERKRALIDRMLRAMPPDQRGATVRDTLDLLIEVDTWGRAPSFEFAHFTDREIATAIHDVETGTTMTLDKRIEVVARIRAKQGNLDKALRLGTRKTQLAEALWPALERKLDRAERRGTVANIPIVRVLDRALDMAQELRRGGVVLPIDPDPQRDNEP